MAIKVGIRGPAHLSRTPATASASPPPPGDTAGQPIGLLLLLLKAS